MCLFCMAFKRRTAKRFYSSIRNKSKYKLVNGLFIVRATGGGNYKWVGDFRKKGSLGATKTTAYVETSRGGGLFNPKKRKMTTSLGYWVKLSIGFRMKPISEILK